ncbi:MAG TPA: plastocyanin/azurin family copper-binding protein [Longimicrobiaceae bacterium]|jgi:plastocyanin|nr:plastocyanin/azurin family copper-binding protein [Longimicrobiaceae bacterium]
MSSFKRELLKLPALGLIVLAAACGGGDKAGSGEQAAPAADTGTAAAAPAAAAPAAAGNTIEVKMVTTQSGAAGQFQPSEITAKKGDVIHFVSDGGAQHNVDFTAAENPGAANLPAPSPYLAAPGQSYDLQVTMDAGTYKFQCDPHAPMGMKGTLTVQ